MLSGSEELTVGLELWHSEWKFRLVHLKYHAWTSWLNAGCPKYITYYQVRWERDKCA